MHMRLADTDQEIAACWPVMHELRPHLPEHGFVDRVRAQQDAGYQLAYLVDDADGVVAVAGFRITQNLASGRHLYVDDLVTLASQRSRGHGARLMDWLRDQARRAGCRSLHLDSGMQRKDAHRFYQRLGVEAVGLHFAAPLDDD